MAAGRGTSYRLAPRLARARSGPRPGVTMRAEIDRAVGDSDRESRADGSRHQPDVAAMGADQLGRDGQSETGPARPRRALKGLEHVHPRLFRNARPGIGHLDHHDAALTPPGDANLVSRRVAIAARFERLHRVARDVDQRPELLVV